MKVMANAKRTISGNNQRRIFKVTYPGNLTINNLELTDGWAYDGDRLHVREGDERALAANMQRCDRLAARCPRPDHRRCLWRCLYRVSWQPDSTDDHQILSSRMQDGWVLVAPYIIMHLQRLVANHARQLGEYQIDAYSLTLRRRRNTTSCIVSILISTAIRANIWYGYRVTPVIPDSVIW